MIEPLAADADDHARREHHAQVRASIESLLEGEDDWVAAMATVACELHHGFAYHHWTGFYRVIAPELLAVGPYQGGHGCLRIPFARGVCGAAARSRRSQRVDDVEAFAGHIACSSTTRSELVVPVLDERGECIAVLDLDSDLPAAFGAVDQAAIESLCAMLGARYGAAARATMRAR
ncbi:MAG: GAF domain-containing protein [Nannocystaceae bacterium]|nr:GAF domain-containing protein [Nannocystaceae bacterium]